MKVLFDSQIFQQQRYGGISRYFCELAARLDASPGTSALIVAPNHRNEFLAGMPSHLVQGWRADRFKRLGKLARFAGRALERRTIARLRPDIIHETYFWGSPLRHRDALRVLTVYDMIHERFADRFDAADPTPGAKRRAVEQADHIICISQSTRRDLLELLPLDPAKVTVIPLASGLVPPAEPATPSGAPYLLYVGDRWTYKNFSQLVAALGASPLLSHLRVVCFGGGPLTEQEWHAVDAAGIGRQRIEQCHGDDTRLAALFASALCLVYPSLYEGFGIPPLEAMRCNCPVVCSNTSSLPEVVGDAAETFDPTVPGALRAALERLVTSEERRAELRALGRQRSEQFSWDACAAQTLALYHRLLKARRSHHA